MRRLWLISSSGIFVLLYRYRNQAIPLHATGEKVCGYIRRVLCSSRRMLALEDRLHQEALRVAIVSTKREHFAKDAAARLTLDMYNKIDGFSDLGLCIGEGGLRVV